MISLRPQAHPVFELMLAHLAEAAVEVFAAYDIAIQPSTDDTPIVSNVAEPTGLAVIGFTGNGVRGALLMAALESAIGTWLPGRVEIENDAERSDAIGEFSNMLLGRLKARLLPEGLRIHLSTPTTALGNGLRVSLPPAHCSWQSFDGPGWRLSVRLDAHFESNFELEPELIGATAAEAGDAFLF